MKPVDVYVVDRDNALKTFKVSELIKFMEKHKKEIGEDKVEAFKKANKTVQKATMCKMICNVITFRKTDLWIKAMEWLMKHEMNGDVY